MAGREIQYYLNQQERPEHLSKRITPEALLESNHSRLAVDRRQEFDNRRSNGTQGLIWLCDDARVWRLDPGSVYFHTIANGGSAESLRNAINSSGVKFGIVMSHGPDCGGRLARQLHVKNGHQPSRRGITGYIDKAVEDHTNLQSVRKAAELAGKTPKQVAAAYQNHLTGELHFFAVYNRTDGGRESHIPLLDILGRPTPASIPHDRSFEALSYEELPVELQTYMQLREKRKKEELARHPHLLDGLQVQRPPLIKIGDNLRSAEVWIPDFAFPGATFRMTVRRTRERGQDGQKATTFSPNDIEHLGDQLEYPIYHATVNRGNPEKPFSNTDTLLIAVSDLSRGTGVATDLAKRDFMPAWLSNEENQVLVAENHAGVLTQVAPVRFKIVNNEVRGWEVGPIIKAA